MPTNKVFLSQELGGFMQEGVNIRNVPHNRWFLMASTYTEGDVPMIHNVYVVICHSGGRSLLLPLRSSGRGDTFRLEGGNCGDYPIEFNLTEDTQHGLHFMRELRRNEVVAMSGAPPGAGVVF